MAIKNLRIAWPEKSFSLHFECSLINQGGKKMSALWGSGACMQFSEINHMPKNQCNFLQLSPAEGHCPYLVIWSLSPQTTPFSQVFPILCLV